MKILEGIVHRNLVRYYGVEVHKVSGSRCSRISRRDKFLTGRNADIHGVLCGGDAGKSGGGERERAAGAAGAAVHVSAGLGGGGVARPRDRPQGYQDS